MEMKNRLLMSWTLFACGSLLVGLPTSVTGQEPPAIPAVTGTIALEGTMDKTYRAANTIVVKTMDGVEHLFHLTGRTVVHGATSTADETLQGLDEGSTIVVHYTVDGEKHTAHEIDRVGEGGLNAMKGVVTRVDRARQQMTIRLADGSEETLRLTERSAADVGKDLDEAPKDTTSVIVYYSDEAGHRVAHYFKRIASSAP
jgi:flagellar hook-associated protein FlgK